MESGLHCGLWFDLDAVFVDQAALDPFVTKLAQSLRRHDVEAVCGPLTGGAFLAQLIARLLGGEFYFTAPAPPAGEGPFNARYHLPPGTGHRLLGKRIAIVDDVMSAGSSLRATLTEVETHGAIPVVVGALYVLGATGMDFFKERGLRIETTGRAPALIGIAAGGYFMTRPDPAPVETIQSKPTDTPTQTQQPTQTIVPKPNAPSNAANTAGAPAPKGAVPETKLAAADPKPTEKVPAKRSTPPAGAAAAPASPAPAPASPAPASPPPSARATVAVSISGGYDFEVWDGSRKISDAAKSHELPPQVNGKTLRLKAPDVFLDHAFKVEGGSENRFEYAAPGLGRIEIRAANGACKAMIGKRDLGFGPWREIPAAAGDYRVDLICPDGQNPFNQITVTQGRPARATFTNK